MYRKKLLFLLTAGILLLTCAGSSGPALNIEYEKFVLDNGLQVVLHNDTSDPVVAVAILYHVGSARELPGKTGFAHLFEHLLFQSSENLKKGEFINDIPNLGGNFNGGTGNDQTVYFEVVPNDALERVLWMESDRLGFFINSVTGPNLETEKQIVKNEKRQGVDNRPYGHLGYIINSNLYPEGHPYSWQVIGSLEDLQSATLEDVKDFYNKWYGPNNATLVIAGDFDFSKTKPMIEKYFGEIKAHGDPKPTIVQPVVISESKKLYHEDNFARLPQLNIKWPTVKQYDPDYYALNMLGQLLSRGKKSPFYKVLVEEKKLTSRAGAYNGSQELAGSFTVSIRGFNNVNLNDVHTAVNEAFTRFETDGFTEKDMDRIKAGLETNFYNGISSVMAKAFQLSMYNVYAGDPGFINTDIKNIQAVTKEDILRVYNKYLKGKNFIAVSVVPKGKTDLVLEGSVRADIVEEDITEAAVALEGGGGEAEFERTPSKIDRAVKPPLGETPVVNSPLVWDGETDNKMKIFGITSDEIPLVQFSIRIKGGMLLDDPSKIGVANLITDMMMAGTQNRTPTELEEAIAELGSRINMYTGRQSITIAGNTLKRNFNTTMGLVEEILMEPRWDEKEFDLIKQRTINNIRQQEANPNGVAANVFNKLIYGEEHLFSNSLSGTISSVESITIDDLKQYYDKYFSPSLAVVHVVGDINQTDAESSLAGLNTRWAIKDVTIPEYEFPKDVDKSKLYFVDIPDSKQSVVRVGYLGMSQKDPDYYPATVMNYRLGGDLTGRFFQILRIEKGYTYGAYSNFGGSNLRGPFTMGTSVQSAVTYDTMKLIKEIMAGYKDGYTAKDLEETKNALIKSNAGSFETLGALVRMLQNISSYDLPYDYIKQREKQVSELTLEEIKELAGKYVNADKMIYFVVGDAKTQLNNLKGLGLGDPILIDRNAVPITSDSFRK